MAGKSLGKTPRVTRLLAFLGLVLLSACTTPQSPPNATIREIHVEGDSDAFPLQVGDFQRTQVIAYAADLSDVSVNYNARVGSLPAASTVYFYPVREPAATAAASLEREFEEVKAAMIWSKNGYWVERHKTVQVAQASGPKEGLLAIYRYTATINGQTFEALTMAHLFIDGGRLVKFRHTFPAASAEDLLREIDRLLTTLRWEGITPANFLAAQGQPI